MENIKVSIGTIILLVKNIQPNFSNFLISLTYYANHTPSNLQKS